MRAWRDLRAALASLSWPRVAAIITVSEVKRHSDTDGTSYEARIEFAYNVDGRSYVGDSLRVGFPFNASKRWAASMVSRYPRARGVEVAVDPANPAVAVLEPGKKSHIFALLVGSGVLTVVGLGLLLYVTMSLVR